MQIGTRQPPIPPRVKFRGVSAVSVSFGMFRPESTFRPNYFFLISLPPAAASRPSLQWSAGQMLLLLLSFAYAASFSSVAAATASSSAVATLYPDVLFLLLFLFFLLLHICPDCFVSFSFLFFFFFLPFCFVWPLSLQVYKVTFSIFKICQLLALVLATCNLLKIIFTILSFQVAGIANLS
jgi:hypothetical protein